MNKFIVGSGGGGKGGGGSARAAVEAANTLKSKSYAKIVEVLCEGEIEGLVNGMNSILLSDTPLQATDGTFNFTDVAIDFRSGTLLQTAIQGFGNTSSTDSLGQEIKYSVPALYTVNNTDVDNVRVTIQIPALTTQNTTNGDTNGASVSLGISYKDGNNVWRTPNVDVTTRDIGTTSTGNLSISGSVSLKSAYTVESRVVGGHNGDGSRTYLTKYSPSTAVVQYSKDGGAWTTIQSYRFSGVTSLGFSLDTVETSTYQVRAYISTGGNAAASMSWMKGTIYTSVLNISGKTTSSYERDVEFALSGPAPYLIKVVRLTADSTLASLQNKTYLASITQIFNEKFRYPGTAYVAVSIDAEQFSSIPTRAYDVKLLKVKIPSNYDPIARTYDGIWDGTFKVAWCDNPAWCFYDLALNRRYGLGDRLSAEQIDKWSLYSIAQYCDELVPDGFGVLAPRFTCNVLIQTREEAYKVLQDMASVFAGLPFWGSDGDGFQGLITVQDKPQDTASYLYNNSNVIDGVFNYSTTNTNTQYNVAYVTYNDPEDSYKQKVVYVPDNPAISSMGYVNDTSITAFGCTSKAQAYRLGKRLLFTNRYENEPVSFIVGSDGAVSMIGDVVKIADSLKSGEKLGGRIIEELSSSSVLLDRSVTLTEGVTYTLAILSMKGKVVETTITTIPGETQVVEFTPAIADGYAVNSAWIIDSPAVSSQLYKVVAVAEKDNNTYEINCLPYNATKYDYVDELGALSFLPATELSVNDPVTDMHIQEVLYTDGVNVNSKIIVSWKPAAYSSRYYISYYTDDNNNRISMESSFPSIDILNTTPTIYHITVIAATLLGTRSTATTKDFEVFGKAAPPVPVPNLSVSSFSNAANITWDLHPDLDVQIGGFIEIRQTPKTVGYVWEDGVPIASVSGNTTATITPLLKGTYMAKAIDSSGNYSVYAAFADSSFAQMQQLNVVASSVQQSAWAGSKTNMLLSADNNLTLSTSGMLDDVTEMIDSLLSWDLLDMPISSSGEYLFDNYIDIGCVCTARASAILESLAIDLANIIDARTTFSDDWASFDGSVVNTTFAKLQISTTLDNPALSSVWSDWSDFLISDYTARGFRFKIVVTNPVPTNNIEISKAEISVDVPDRVDGNDNITCPVGGVQITYTNPFYAKPSVAIRIDGMQQGDFYEFVTNTNAGFYIKFKNSSGTYVSRQFDYISKGWGYVQ